MKWWHLLVLTCVCYAVDGGGRSTFHDGDDDLMSFFSESTLRPPKINVTIYDPSRVSSGYWFVAPYGDLMQQDPGKLAVAAQVGPHIFASDGTLIWSGAGLFPTRTVTDFRLSMRNGRPMLSFILMQRPSSQLYPHTTGLIYDTTYSFVSELPHMQNETKLDMHELKFVDDGSTALVIFNTPIRHESGADHSWGFADSGFSAIDVKTGEASFSWDASQHISRNTSSGAKPAAHSYTAWDWLHLNSVDRNDAGDFLVSARYTDSIYKISSLDRSILWQLGGHDSSFEPDGFTFARQHDARFVEENATTTIISLLDNASDDMNSSKKSSALLIALYHDAMVARVLRRWYRPDGDLSYYRGNLQLLPDTNVFVGWGSQDNYMTEHSRHGDLVMEARFLSDRISTYRAYKYFDYVGVPVNPPSLKVIEHTAQFPDCSHMTVFYVSWNGATEVAFWNFYISTKDSAADASLIGAVKKTGFETSFAWASTAPFVFAEAVAADGTSLRNSSVLATAALPSSVEKSCGAPTDIHRDIYLGAGDAMLPYHDIESRMWRGRSLVGCAQALTLLLLGLCLSIPLNKLLRWHQRRRNSILW